MEKKEMENVANVHRCGFRWDIYNPFLTWQKLQTTFHHGSPTVTQWKATLQPMDRGTSYWDFAFSLELDEWFKHRHDIPAQALYVVIKLNGEVIIEDKVLPCYFCKANWYTYYLPARAVMSPEKKPHHLAINFIISLPGTDEGNGLYFLEEDLKWLSSDLKKLLRDQQCCNMMLKSKNHAERIKVHSYMIDARWNNFFTKHPSEEDTSKSLSEVQPIQEGEKPKETPKLVEIEISHGLLLDILTYIYSGTLSITWPDWHNSDERNAAHIAELFQVIDGYKLYDLHKAFANDLKQQRVTRNHMLIESRLFPLNSTNGKPVKDFSCTWNMNPNLDCKFIFKIKVSKDDLDFPWLSYSLQSISQSKIYAQVTLEVVRKVKGNDAENILTLVVHGKDYSLDSGTTVESNNAFFLGCPEIFGDGSDRIQHFIKFSFRATNGTAADEIRCVYADTLQNDLERLSVLSNDMYKLEIRKEYVDCKLQSPHIVDKGVYLYCLHKDILNARVLYLNRVINEKVEKFPQIKMLSHKTISFVLDYIYTGKVFPIDLNLLDEAEDFARKAEFPALLDLVGRIRLHEMN